MIKRRWFGLSVEKMVFVNIAGMTSDLDATLERLNDSGCFHIESAAKFTGKDQGYDKSGENNPYAALLRQLGEISSQFGIKYASSDYEPIKNTSLNKLSAEVKKIRNKLENIKSIQKVAGERLSMHEQALYQVTHMKGLDVDFQRIFALEHIKVRFGRLPADSFEKLSYYEDKIFFFHSFSIDKEYYWGLYFTPVFYVDEIDDIFDSLYFERIRVPDFVRGDSEEALAELEKTVRDEKRLIEENDAITREILDKERLRLNLIFSKIKEAHDNFDLRRKASIVNDKFYIVGFIPESEVKRFEKLFDDLSGVSAVMQPADKNGKIPVPIKLKNGRFSEPFSMFVGMYGLPSYNGINPTAFVAVSYTLLFGIMFGDLGQGIIISILGALLWKTKKFALGPIMTRIGISSAVFGALYGSVFGYEEWLDPIYEAAGISFLPFKAMNNASSVLYIAIGIGVFIMFVSMILGIITGFRNKDYEMALFGNNGIAGLVFFGALLAGIVCAIMGGGIFSPAYVLGFIIVPLIIMFFRHPLSSLVKGRKYHFEGAVDFIAGNFFELFEFLLGYATNTLSFVRIGGFILSHAGMMSVVHALSETASSGTSVAVIIIGNIFVMGMEGLIVGIQVLRLEFYEMFSRFYKADGKAFEPVKINYDNIEN